MSKDVAARIRSFIEQEVLLGDTSAAVDESTPLLNGILDSLALAQLVGYIEEEFGTEIDDGDITADNFKTIGDIQRLIEERASA